VVVNCNYPPSTSFSGHQSSERYRMPVYTHIPFVHCQGFLVRMFGQRDSAFFIESLLKMNARNVYLIGDVPGWPNALMAQNPSTPDAPPAAAMTLPNSPSRHFWLLDFVPSPTVTRVVVPQKIWTPPNQSDWRRYAEQANLRMPIFFVRRDGSIGLSLTCGTAGDTASLHLSDSPALLGGGHSTQIRIAVGSTSPCLSFCSSLFPLRVFLRLNLSLHSSGPDMIRGNARYRSGATLGIPMGSGMTLGIPMRSRWNGSRSSLRASLTDFSRCGFSLFSPFRVMTDVLTFPICISYVACSHTRGRHPRSQLEDRRGRDHSPRCCHYWCRASVRRRVDANFRDLFVVPIFYAQPLRRVLLSYESRCILGVLDIAWQRRTARIALHICGKLPFLLAVTMQPK